VLLEKLIVSKLVNKFPAISGPRNFITIRSALFWNIKQPILVSPYRRFEKTLEDGTDNLSQISERCIISQKTADVIYFAMEA
jgi:hypothetical protein